MSVYKYMPTHTPDKKVNLLQYIFEDRTLRFSTPLVFNDPFELRPYIKKMIPKNVLQKAFFNPLNATNKAHEFHYMSFPTLSDDIGILCLSATKDNLVMWGNYADNHKGIVIEFDKKHPFFSPDCNTSDFVHTLQKVVYVEKRLSMNSDEWAADTRTFLAKSKHWEYENEYRMPILYEENNKNPDKFNIKFPSNLIKSVYIGCKAKKETIDYIENLKTQKQWEHLDIYHMSIDEEEYKLNQIKL